MLFNSLEFLVFFPVVCLCYYVIPHRVRYLFLLACSYFFYMCWNPEYALLMLTSTAITYASGLLIDSAEKLPDEKKRICRKKWYVALSFISNLAILFFFKYFDFAAATAVRLLGIVGLEVQPPVFDVILPVGISFYTFQALSYTVDVYRRDIYAERNFCKYALFVSFFPQLVAGPIERSKNLLVQINERHRFEFERVRDGLLLMLYGFFQKVVLAEYLAIAVNGVYNTYTERTGFQLLVATVLFAFQIYCDFGSYSNIAIGAAKVMGFRLMENFNTPYFAVSVADFWRRWHISLSTWFRDYLYIPLGGNRKGRVRKWFNLMVVFLVSGLWHGANWHFVIWGGLNGAYQVIGEWLRPLRERIMRLCRVDRHAASHRVLQMLITFVLVDISWVFFRASFAQGVEILKRIAGLGSLPWFTWGDNLAVMGLTPQTRNLLVLSLAVLIFADICKYRGIRVIEWLTHQGVWLRWLVYFAGIFGVLVFGVYGPGYNATQFIYFQF
ncbi:MBOAT family O-acyltransferase [Parablautia sp. Marseille-Q6255]|uniref:MBOAT family O-acyltransferase n=1 Tax=Parablautia sp. Marseille-Q6255 TaxID=3039593 RepID=UPI0024BBF7C7|nr:MBOAT family O-acyltransferase [Parablautia sp. Marseille-Q6255]